MKKYFVEIIFSMKRNNGIIWILLALCSLCFFWEKVLYSYIKTMELTEDKDKKTYNRAIYLSSYR